MKIALCQINTIIGDINGNKEKIKSYYKNASELGAELVVFPELSLPGYPPLDLVEKKEFREKLFEAAKEIAALTGEVGLLFGCITEDDDEIGTNIFNSALLCFDGKIQFVQNKTLIPNYDVFDEMRYFESAKSVSIFDFKGEKLGISICEDIWNDKDFWKFRRYPNDPIERLIKQNATLLINISASPYSFGKRKEKMEMLSTISKNDRIPLLYCCCIGAQTELIFDGASMCFNNKGELFRLGKSYDEDILIYDSLVQNNDQIITIEENFENEIHDALILGIKDYCTKLGFNKVLIGLSGGIDSAIVTYLAVKAVGTENVYVVLLPSKFSSQGSVDDSLKLIKNLGINHTQISIQPTVDEIISTLTPFFQGKEEDVTEENIQSRVRGLFLMALSNKHNYLLLTTGNKSEIATGYATLYGDMCGALAVIGDVYKTDIYRLAGFINTDQEIIPKEIIQKPPSAELKYNQTDQDSLPEYEILDKILRMYLEQNKEINEISEVINDYSLVEKVLKLVDKNEFKRKQAAPVLRVSRKAFGYGRRYPIVQKWR